MHATIRLTVESRCSGSSITATELHLVFETRAAELAGRPGDGKDRGVKAAACHAERAEAIGLVLAAAWAIF